MIHKTRIEKMRKYMPGKTDFEISQLLRNIELPDDLLKQIPKMATGTILPFGAKLNELMSEIDSSRHSEIVDLLKQILAGKESRGTKPTKDTKPRGKPGRPHLPDDEWAWEQIHALKRPKAQVKREWLKRLDADPKRMNIPMPSRDRIFKRIAKWEWGIKRD